MVGGLRKSKKVNLYIGLAFFLIVIAIDVFFFQMEENNYHEKIEIIVSMLESDDNLITATSLLKGEVIDSNDTDGSILEGYGYTDSFKDHYKQERNLKFLYIILLSGVVYILAMILTRLLVIVINRTHREELDEIELVITNLRNGVYDLSKIEGNDRYRLKDSTIYMELESLGNTLKILQEQTKTEKEETKSLVTDISHQLKTPVAALKACFEILQQTDLTDKEREEFSMRCNQQLRGLENMLAALINISRMETGMIEINREKACIFDTFVEAVNRVYVKAEEKKISVEVESEDDIADLKVFHDRKWLCEAFINVLENGIKYSPTGSRITTRFILRTTFLRIEIEDQGIGVNKEEVSQIFKRFYRGQSAKVKVEEGSGVGLYLTREIISRHGGTITVYPSKTGYSGSIFVFQIPYAMTESANIEIYQSSH